ncbi:MAG: hypothetical protein IID43_06070 [Planctomycetes bacterium]|nr:hypothetical protein [Planctomycetota bacterium]
MRKLAAFTVAFGLLAGASSAVDTYTASIVLPNGNETEQEQPLAIEIHAIVTNESPGNQGLAYFSVDFSMTGPSDVELATAIELATPPPDPMTFFARNLGYDAGYGGTGVGNDLLQAGGALNTIGNDPAQDPFLEFPSAMNIPLDVAHTNQIILSGTITFPAEADDGIYTLSLDSLLANLITVDAIPGDFAIYPVEAANAESGGSVEIIVGGEFCIVHGPSNWDINDNSTWVSWYDQAFSSYLDPAIESDNGVDHNLGITQFDVVFGSEPFGDAGGGAITTGNVSVSVTAGVAPTVTSLSKSGNVLTVTIDSNTLMPLQEWTTYDFQVFDGDGARSVEFDDVADVVRSESSRTHHADFAPYEFR